MITNEKEGLDGKVTTKQRIFDKLKRWFPPVRLGMIVLAFILIMTLFVPPANGMADNGSYGPILRANGLYEYEGNTSYFKHFVSEYPILQYYNPEQYDIMSLQNILIQSALLLNKMLFSTKMFDIRFLAFIYCVLYLIGMWILMTAVTKKMDLKKSYIAVGVAVFLLGDTSYLVYFNSFYRNPLLFILFIYFVGLGALAYQQSTTNRVFFCLILQFIVALMVPAVSHTSGSFMIGMMIALSGSLFFIRDGNYKVGVSIFIVALLPLTMFITTMVATPDAEKEKFNSMSVGVLQVADNPGKAMAALGMEPQYEMMRGTNYDQTYVIEKSTSKSVKENFIDYIKIWRTSIYYLVHPEDLLRMLNIGLENQNISKQNNATDAEKSAYRFQQIQDLFFRGASRVKGAFLPKKFAFYIIVSLAVIVVYSVVAFRGIQMGTKVYLARLLAKIGLVVMMLTSFFVPIIVSGTANMIQEMQIASTIVDILLIVVLGDYLRHDLWLDKKQVMLYQIDKKGGKKDDQ